MTGYERLTSAIIEQAVRDYRAAVCTLKKKPDSITARAAI